MDKLKVGFICVHNSCRSQMAEAIAKFKYSDIMDVYSAGTDISRPINIDAIRIIKEIYSIDMTDNQKPKLISNVPDLDVVITMGCDVQCPIVKNQYTEDWDLNDPTNLPDVKYIETINAIENKLSKLVKKLGL